MLIITAELHFEKQDSAEKFTEVFQGILNKKGKENVEIEATIINVFETDNEIANEMIEAISVVSDLKNDGKNLHDFLDEMNNND